MLQLLWELKVFKTLISIKPYPGPVLRFLARVVTWLVPVWILDMLITASLATTRYALMSLIVWLAKVSEISLRTVYVSWNKSWLRSYQAIAWMIQVSSMFALWILDCQQDRVTKTKNLRSSELLLQILPSMPSHDLAELKVKLVLIDIDQDLIKSQLGLADLYLDMVNTRLLKIKQGRAPQDRV